MIGPYQEDQTIVTSYTRLIMAYDAFQAIYDDYTADLNAYNILKTAYNTKITEAADEVAASDLTAASKV